MLLDAPHAERGQLQQQVRAQERARLVLEPVLALGPVPLQPLELARVQEQGSAPLAGPAQQLLA